MQRLRSFSMVSLSSKQPCLVSCVGQSVRIYGKKSFLFITFSLSPSSQYHVDGENPVDCPCAPHP